MQFEETGVTRAGFVLADGRLRHDERLGQIGSTGLNRT